MWKNLLMNSGLFGDGSISLDWSGIEGLPGLQPRLVLIGKLVAKSYGIGAVIDSFKLLGANAVPMPFSDLPLLSPMSSTG